jgi:hypothetical protein
MKVYIENIPFEVDGYTNKIQTFQQNFSKYLGGETLLFKTDSKYLDSVRDWYQNITKYNTYNSSFNVYYTNSTEEIFTTCYPKDWQYNSRTGFVEIEMKVSFFIFIKKLYERDTRKDKLIRINECQKYL